MTNLHIQITRSHILVVVLALAIVFGVPLALAWTNPTQAPPNGNVSLPSAQWTASGTAIYNSNSGNVGIGITGPGQKLSVAGTIESTSGGFRFPDGTVQTSTAKEGGTWSTPVRAKDTVYQNTSGKKRRVAGDISIQDGAINGAIIEVGSANPPTITLMVLQHNDATAGPELVAPFYFEVPNNWYYRIGTNNGTISVNRWHELDE